MIVIVLHHLAIDSDLTDVYLNENLQITTLIYISSIQDFYLWQYFYSLEQVFQSFIWSINAKDTCFLTAHFQLWSCDVAVGRVSRLAWSPADALIRGQQWGEKKAAECSAVAVVMWQLEGWADVLSLLHVNKAEQVARQHILSQMPSQAPY